MGFSEKIAPDPNRNQSLTMTEGIFLEGSCLDTVLLNLNNYIPQIYQAKKIILLFPEMRVTKKIFTRAAAKKKKFYQWNFLNKVYN